MSLFGSAFSGWFTWGLVLFIGLPLFVILLGEASQALRHSRFAAYQKPLDLFRGSALFLLFISILLQRVMELPPNHMAVMVVDTVLWIAVLNASLALANSLIFDTRNLRRTVQTPKLLVDLGQLFLVAVGAAIIVSYVWKVDLTGLIAALGVGSVVVGLALQDTLGNVFSGLTMLSSSTFRVGSWIKVGEIEGQVRSISMRSVTLALADGSLMDISNSAITKEKVVVLGAAHAWSTVGVEVKIDQEFAPEKVREVFLQAARAVPGVLEQPAPAFSIKSYEGGDIVYKISLNVSEYGQRAGAASEFLSFLWYVAAREGLRLRPPEPTSPFRLPLPLEQGGQSPAMAPTVSLADQLEAAGTFQVKRPLLELLARDARMERYRKGELLLDRSRRVHHAFVVKTGTAQVSGNAVDNATSWTFGAGDLILFKSSFRNAEAPTSVRCMSDLDVIAIPMASLTEGLAKDSKLAETIERMLSAREAAWDPSQRRLSHPDGDVDRVQILQALFQT